MRIKFFSPRIAALGASTIIASLIFSTAAQAAGPLSLTDTPLYLNGSVPPLNLLVMGRDHKLYYEAYNDHADLDGDERVDTNYKPTKITYFGYFDSKKCYSYSSTNSRFEPAADAGTDKTCDGTKWSGDWLNYVTTSRMDALRKVLYGGLRSTDDAGLTVLERANVPQDAHSWGKSYESEAHDGYDIHKYTPLNQPATDSAHLFANTTVNGDTKPLLRILKDRKNGASKPLKIWNWVSIERMVADTKVVTGTKDGKEVRTDVTIDNNLVVRVVVCDKSKGLEANCRAYTDASNKTNYKPGGLLQDFGEQDLMKFGLLTGSYQKNTNGGVLRKNVGSIKDEINTDGTFKDVPGIIRTLNNFRTTNFNGTYGCGWKVKGPITSGECQMWGNPVAEMMYEGLRYFAGSAAGFGDFATTAGAGEEFGLNLPVASWVDPYKDNPRCARPFETVISDVNVSYDSDKLPGTSFGGFTTDQDLGGMNVSQLGQTIWDKEMAKEPTDQKYYIGNSKSDLENPNDRAPTAKKVTSFGNIRGIAPEEPTKEGSYYSASVAYWGNTKDINPTKNDDQKVATFAVALASPLPRIEIKMGNGKYVTLIPFAKTVGGYVNSDTVKAGVTDFQPTNQIVDFYVDTLDETSGKFRVNFEDVEQGADHDMDAIAIYEYKVNGDKVDVTITSEYAAGSLIQHIGYVISGTQKDGTYFVVRDTDTAEADDPDYYLDTPATGTWNDKQALLLTNKRTFTVGTTPSAKLLKDPLWYAAKWGGFKDENKDGFPTDADGTTPSEWDENKDGDPDNYFLVTNALTLGAQLTKAFNEIRARTTSASSASVNSGSISSKTRVYQARFNSGDWSGELFSYPVISRKEDGTVGSIGTAEWNAATKMPAANSRAIITVNEKGVAVPFRWASIGDVRKGQLQPGDDQGEKRLNYLRGDSSNEIGSGGLFRKRNTSLGDIVNSSPLFVGTPPFGYQEQTYLDFRDANTADRSEDEPTEAPKRQPMVYVGGNDGMLHAFDAETGVEKLAFIPSPVFRNLPDLTKPSYAHRYYVDGTPSMGDVFYGGDWHTMLIGGLNKGGQGIYALDITNPKAFSESAATDIVRWEFTDANDADLGYTYGKPAIVKVRTASGSRWAAVFGNGYNNTLDDTATGGQKSATGNAALYFVDIEKGTLIRKIDTNTGIDADDPQKRPNGLATPAMVDLNNDGIVDYAFAGDLFGNLWKFDLTTTDPTKWKIATKDAAPMFVAKDGSGNRQPITSRPEVGLGPKGRGMVVLVGTGKFLETGDNIVANLKTQTFYGLYDPNTSDAAIAGRSALTPQSIIFEGMGEFTRIETEMKDTNGDGKPEEVKKTITETAPVRVTTKTKVEKQGWYLDLLSGPPGLPPPKGFKGEMSVSDPVLRNGRVIFTTIIPNDDPCTDGGTSWVMELDSISGGRLDYTPLDLNDDQIFDSQDYVTLKDEKGNVIKDEDGNPIRVPAGGVKTDVGMGGKPGILGGGKVEFKYVSGTNGNLQVIRENPGPGDTGRQSWRQMR